MDMIKSALRDASLAAYIAVRTRDGPMQLAVRLSRLSKRDLLAIQLFERRWGCAG